MEVFGDNIVVARSTVKDMDILITAGKSIAAGGAAGLGFNSLTVLTWCR